MIEALGTLQVRPNSSPAAIASFSLRAVSTLRQDTTMGLPHSRQPHCDESAIARKPDPSTPRHANSHPTVGQFEFID